MGSAGYGLQALRPLMKKRWATRSRGTGLLPQRTGAVIMRQTVMTHCSPTTFLKMTTMVTVMHPADLYCVCLKTGQTRKKLHIFTLTVVRKPMAVTIVCSSQPLAAQHSTAQHSTAQHSTAQQLDTHHSTSLQGDSCCSSCCCSRSLSCMPTNSDKHIFT